MPETLTNWGSQLFVYVIIFALGAISSRLLRRAGVLLFRPLQWWQRGALAFLRFLGVELKTGLRGTRTAITGATHRHGRPQHLTEIECALRGLDREDENSSQYDLANDAQLLTETGFFFKSMRVPGEYLPSDLQGTFSEEIADSYLKEATHFFGQKVPITVNPYNLYEDEEGAVIIRMLRNCDRRCFYFLDRIRRLVGRNALFLILFEFFFFIILLFGFFIILYNYTTDIINTHFIIAWALDNHLHLLAGVIFLLLGFGLSFYLQRSYGAEGQHNMRELSDYLTRYFSMINNRFREASARATRVIQGDERDAQILASGARKWQIIMVWLAFRPFFIESFVRNVYFQMRRNLQYYQIFSFAIFTVTSFSFILIVAKWFPESSAGTRVCFIILALLSALLCYWQTHRKVILRELDQKNWLGFDDLEVGKQMGEVIGKYAEEIGQWKGRFERG